MLAVVTFKWRQAGYPVLYTAEHVNRLARAVRRNYPEPHTFYCVTDDPEGLDEGVRYVPLWSDFSDIGSPHGANYPSCYRRLRLFSSEAREIFGSRLVSIDLDAVVTGDLRPLWNRPDDFVIWQDPTPGRPYCGSMFLLTAGARAAVWEQFDPATSITSAAQAGYAGSDQAWIAYCLGRKEPVWTPSDGVLSFKRHVRPHGLPRNARVVFFHGNPKPWDALASHDWIRTHWI